jgi:hypothetical protein
MAAVSPQPEGRHVWLPFMDCLWPSPPPDAPYEDAASERDRSEQIGSIGSTPRWQRVVEWQAEETARLDDEWDRASNAANSRVKNQRRIPRCNTKQPQRHLGGCREVSCWHQP